MEPTQIKVKQKELLIEHRQLPFDELGNAQYFILDRDLYIKLRHETALRLYDNSVRRITINPIVIIPRAVETHYEL